MDSQQKANRLKGLMTSPNLEISCNHSKLFDAINVFVRFSRPRCTIVHFARIIMHVVWPIGDRKLLIRAAEVNDANENWKHWMCLRLLLTLSPPNKLYFAIYSRLLQFSKCFNVAQSWSKCYLSVKQLWSGWDAELLVVSSGSKLFAYCIRLCLAGKELMHWMCLRHFIKALTW